MINRILLWLSLILIFSIPWEDMISLPLIGSLARLTGIIVFGFWMLKFIISGQVRKLHFFHVILYFFVLWNFASIFWTYGFDETKTRIITFFQLFFMTLIFWDVFQTPAELNAGLQAYVLGTWVGVIDLLVNFSSGVIIEAYDVGRYSPSGVNAGDFVVILALGLPIAWYLARFAKSNSKNRFLSIINYTYIPVSGFAIFLTGSRLALFVIAPAFLYILGTVIQPKRIFTSVFLLIVIFGALLKLQTLIPAATWDRFSTTKSSVLEGDLGGRVPIWKDSITAFSEHPILGVGGGAFRTVNPYKSAAHNTYLSVLAELGVIGFLLFFSILAVVCYSIMCQSGPEIIFWFTTLLVLLIGIFIQTWEFTKTTYLIFILIVINASFVKHRTIHETKPKRSKAAEILAGT
jgi:O-antigen ligase